MKLIRELHRGMRGPDVRALKRALRKAGYRRGIVLSSYFGDAVHRQLIAFQKSRHLAPDGELGPKTFAKLLPYVDRYGRKLFSQAPRMSEADLVYAKLLKACHEMADATPGYLLGGGHGIRISQINIHGPTDCSSSTSWVTWKAGLLPDVTTLLSWDFETWGLPGTGKYFTIYSNSEHVWIRLYKGPFWRFDTSPHGDGGRGPRLRRLPRFTFGFVPRHARGL